MPIKKTFMPISNIRYGKLMPIETAIEAFQDQELDFISNGKDEDVLAVIRSRYEIFTMALTWGHLRSVLNDLLVRELI
jgi:hypothetical protein